MSSILKALRKLEEEKSRNTGGTPDIARNILKMGPRRKKSSWLLPASVVALLLAFSMTGYILWGETEFPSLPSESPQALLDMAPATDPPPAKETPAPAAAAPVVSQAPEETSAPSELLHAVSAAEKEIPYRPPSAAPFPAAPKAPQKPVNMVQSPGIAKEENAEPLPALALSGIAFQDEREGRLAVVNNLPVMEGTVIAGARVVEISEDRVRFDFSGRSFEVLLEEPAETK